MIRASLAAGVMSMLLLTSAASAGERHVVRDREGRRDLVVEKGVSGNYIVRDSRGRRVGTGYRRMDGSIAIFDADRKRIATIERRDR